MSERSHAEEPNPDESDVLLAGLAAELRGSAAAPPRELLLRRAHRRSRRRVAVQAAGVLVVVAVVMAGTLPLLERDVAEVELVSPGDRQLGASARPPTPNGSGSWRRLPTAPISARWGAFAAWTGEEFLVRGGYEGAGTPGERVAGDGAAYDPEEDAWRRLATGSATGQAPTPAYAGQALWTGSEMLVLGGLGGTGREGLQSAAAYDPAMDTWRRLPDLPVELGSAALVHGTPTLVGATSAGDRHAVWQLLPTGWERVAEAPDGLGPSVVAVDRAGDLRLTDGQTLAVEDDTAVGGWELVDLGEGDAREAVPGGLSAAESDGSTVVLTPDALVVADLPHVTVMPLDGFSTLLMAGSRAVTFPSSALAPLEVVVHDDEPFRATAPLDPRSGAAAAASVDQLFLWGGADGRNLPLGDGAVLELPPAAADSLDAIPQMSDAQKRLFELDGDRLTEVVTYGQGTVRYVPPPAGVVPATGVDQAMQAAERTGGFGVDTRSAERSQTFLALQQSYERADGELRSSGEARLVWVLRFIGVRDWSSSGSGDFLEYETEVRAVIDATTGEPAYVESARADAEAVAASMPG